MRVQENSNSLARWSLNALEWSPTMTSETPYNYEVLFPSKARHSLAKPESRTSYDLIPL